MVPDKLNRKYFPLIWVALIVASFVRNIFPLYVNIAGLQGVTPRLIVVDVLLAVFEFGIVPTALCFVCALVVYSIGFRRYVRCISRNDFVYYTMLFTAAARFVMGIIECFAILDPQVYVVTSLLLDLIVLTAALAVMYFAVFVRRYKFNPVEQHNSFRMWSSIYIVGVGVLCALPSLGVLILSASLETLPPETLAEIYDAMANANAAYAYNFIFSDIAFAASFAAVIIYIAEIIAVVAVSATLRKRAVDFQDPDKRTQYNTERGDNTAYRMRDDVYSTYRDEHPFDEFGGAQTQDKKDDNVFDEFDI